jgi:hypothetical protein
MIEYGNRPAPTATLAWIWIPSTKSWLVEAHSMRDRRSRLIAQCWVQRSDPLPDDLIKRFLPAIVDYWQSLTLF